MSRRKVADVEMGAEMVAPTSLVPWEKNPRAKQPIEEVMQSIRLFGFAAPIVARKADRVVIAGHTRLQAALRLGLDLVPVRFMDLTEAQAHALSLADNKLGELAEWDDALLLEQLAGLAAVGVDLQSIGWDPTEVLPTAEVVEAPDPLPVHTGPIASVVGELYELGPHRLVCGDSSRADTWAKLGSGPRYTAVWTDPPYGVAYESAGRSGRLMTAEQRKVRRKLKQHIPIANDTLSGDELGQLLESVFANLDQVVVPGGVYYVAAPGGPLYLRFAEAMDRRGLYRHQLIWVKDRLVLGRSDRHYAHEPIIYGWKDGAHVWTGGRARTTVLHHPKPASSDLHPTTKPVSLIVDCLECHDPANGWVVDPFGGSGSTLMAAAQLGMRADLVELEPRYCDVIRDRWTRWAQASGVDPGSGAYLIPQV